MLYFTSYLCLLFSLLVLGGVLCVDILSDIAMSSYSIHCHSLDHSRNPSPVLVSLCSNSYVTDVFHFSHVHLDKFSELLSKSS